MCVAANKQEVCGCFSVVVWFVCAFFHFVVVVVWGVKRELNNSIWFGYQRAGQTDILRILPQVWKRECCKIVSHDRGLM